MHPLSQPAKRPHLRDRAAQEVSGLDRLGTGRAEAATARLRRTGLGPLGRRRPHRGDLDERDHHIQHGAQQRLHPIEPFGEVTVQAQRHQLVQPRHQVPGTILPEVEDLRRVGVPGLHETVRVEAISQERHVMPKDLIHNVIGVQVQSRHRDRAFRLAPAQRVGVQQDHVASTDGLLSERAVQDSRPGPDYHQFHTIERDGRNRLLKRPRLRNNRHERRSVHDEYA